MTQTERLAAGIRKAVADLANGDLRARDSVRSELSALLTQEGLSPARPRAVPSEISSDGREYVGFRIYAYYLRDDTRSLVLPYTDEMKAYLHSHTRRKPTAALVQEIVEFNQSVEDDFYVLETSHRRDAETIEHVLNMNNLGVRFGNNEMLLRSEKVAALALFGLQAVGSALVPPHIVSVLGRPGTYGIAETFDVIEGEGLNDYIYDVEAAREHEEEWQGI